MTSRANERDKREAGMALLVAVVLLALMGIMGLSSLDTVTRDRQVAGYQSRAQTALYASEGGVAFAMALLRRDAQQLGEGGEGALYAYNPSSGTPPDFPEPGAPEVLGAGTFPAGQPRFFRDPAARDPNDLIAAGQAIRYIGRGNP